MKELMSKQQLSLGDADGGSSAQIQALESILDMLKQREGMKLSGKGDASGVEVEVDPGQTEDAKPGLDPKLEGMAEGGDSEGSDEDKLKQLYASMKL